MPAIPKHLLRTRRQDTARQRRQQAQARRACTDQVWGGRFYAPCHYCGRTVQRGGTFYKAVGAVHEPGHRSLGADPTNPDEGVIVCHDCHYNGPSGAHRSAERRSA